MASCNNYVDYLRPAPGELLKQNESACLPIFPLQPALHLILFQLSIQKSSQLLNRKCSVTCMLLMQCVTDTVCYLCNMLTNLVLSNEGCGGCNPSKGRYILYSTEMILIQDLCTDVIVFLYQ